MNKLMSDVHEFHAKFGLDAHEPGVPSFIKDPDLQLMRANFMLEELVEYAECVGLQLEVSEAGVQFTKGPHFDEEQTKNLQMALDGLVDLAYVVMGTALFHGFGTPTLYDRSVFDEAWLRVHLANKRKMRAPNASKSKRKSAYDVIKPEGWQAPKFDDIVRG